MNTHYTYLLVDLGCLLVPLLFSFHPSIRFDREWKFIALPALVVSLFFLVWDALFTAHGVWGFNPDYLLGIYVYNLPLEEILFFLCIPYACVFTYFCIHKFVPALRTKNVGIFAILLASALILAGLLNYTHLYTLTTLVLCGAGILAARFLIPNALAVFFTAYLLVIPFFLLSNGILTGTFLAAPVVWYNNEEMMGVRMLTIPAEDIFYGMLLILMNVTGYEWMRARQNVRT